MDGEELDGHQCRTEEQGLRHFGLHPFAAGVRRSVKSIDRKVDEVSNLGGGGKTIDKTRKASPN